jgi:hypothetical protein
MTIETYKNKKNNNELIKKTTVNNKKMKNKLTIKNNKKIFYNKNTENHRAKINDSLLSFLYVKSKDTFTMLVEGKIKSHEEKILIKDIIKPSTKNIEIFKYLKINKYKINDIEYSIIKINKDNFNEKTEEKILIHIKNIIKNSSLGIIKGIDFKNCDLNINKHLPKYKIIFKLFKKNKMKFLDLTNSINTKNCTIKNNICIFENLKNINLLYFNYLNSYISNNCLRFINQSCNHFYDNIGDDLKVLSMFRCVDDYKVAVTKDLITGEVYTSNSIYSKNIEIEGKYLSINELIKNDKYLTIRASAYMKKKWHFIKNGKIYINDRDSFCAHKYNNIYITNTFICKSNKLSSPNQKVVIGNPENYRSNIKRIKIFKNITIKNCIFKDNNIKLIEPLINDEYSKVETLTLDNINISFDKLTNFVSSIKLSKKIKIIHISKEGKKMIIYINKIIE